MTDKMQEAVDKAKAQAIIEGMIAIGESKPKSQLAFELAFVTIYLHANHPEVLAEIADELEKAIKRRHA